ncbi:hypothetical protein JRX38_13245 [Gluconobacter cerinus]|nr:hypothetical protein [Gluconobacter cerinus]
MEVIMSFRSSTPPKNPTKALGSPDEREPFDPYPDKSPITDEPPEEENPGKRYAPEKGSPDPKPDQPPVLPDAPENPTN